MSPSPARCLSSPPLQRLSPPLHTVITSPCNSVTSPYSLSVITSPAPPAQCLSSFLLQCLRHLPLISVCPPLSMHSVCVTSPCTLTSPPPIQCLSSEHSVGHTFPCGCVWIASPGPTINVCLPSLWHIVLCVLEMPSRHGVAVSVDALEHDSVLTEAAPCCPRSFARPP